jgi:hypothetical protein
MTLRDPVALIRRVDVSVYRIPTDMPESDGALEWDAPTLVTVFVGSDGVYARPNPKLGKGSLILTPSRKRT